MTVISYILAILLFGLMIGLHEFGHFATAKLFGIKVNEFSIGMGPQIWHKKKGETEYSLRAFPIGGFCAIEGEDGEQDADSDGLDAESCKEHEANALAQDAQPSKPGEFCEAEEYGQPAEPVDPDRLFYNKPWWQRLIVLAAGAIMNIILCFVILVCVITHTGFASSTLSAVNENSPAWNAGIRAGDTIIAVDETVCDTWNDVAEAINSSEGRPIVIKADRDGEILEFSCAAEESEIGRYIIGINAGIYKSFPESVKLSCDMMKSYSTAIFDWLNTLVHGQASKDDVAGVVGIVSMTAEQAKLGPAAILLFMAMISLNLGIVNLLPLPALDGGRILFVFIRLITRGKLSARAEAYVHTAGMVLLLALMVFLAINDVTRLVK